jgi:hypothetical protein
MENLLRRFRIDADVLVLDALDNPSLETIARFASLAGESDLQDDRVRTLMLHSCTLALRTHIHILMSHVMLHRPCTFFVFRSL